MGKVIRFLKKTKNITSPKIGIGVNWTKCLYKLLVDKPELEHMVEQEWDNEKFNNASTAYANLWFYLQKMETIIHIKKKGTRVSDFLNCTVTKRYLPQYKLFYNLSK